MKLTKRQKNRIGFAAGGIGLIVVAVCVTTVFRMDWFQGREAPSPSNEDKTGALVSNRELNRDLNFGAGLPGIEVKHVDSYSRAVIHTGTVQTKSHTMVAFQRGGLVNDLLVDEGQRVAANQDVAVLDSRHLQARKDSLAARLDQAKSVLAELQKGPRDETIAAARNSVADLKAQLDAQELRLKRSEKLMNSDSIARQEYERELYASQGLEARLAAAQSQLDKLLAGTRVEQVEAQQALIKSLEADLQIVKYNLDDCRLQAPFAGMIVARFIDGGTVVTAGTPVFELIDDQHLEIHVGVPRKLASQLQAGTSYNIVANDTGLTAVLRSVLPRIDASTQTSKVILDVTLEADQPLTLVAGQLARVELVEQINEPGFWIPRLALTADHSGLWCCYSVDGQVEGQRISGTIVKQSVEILHMRDEWVFVRGTLRDGQILISDGMHRVVPGQEVVVQLSEPQTDSSSKLSNTSLPSGSTN